MPLTVKVFDQNNAALGNATVSWSSSHPGVATVSAQGLVTAVSNGTATITARSGSASATTAVTVMQSAGRIVLEPSSATLMSLGETVQLSASVHDANGQDVEDAAISWSSSDDGVATVSSQGLVTAVSNGTATITARSGSASSTAVVTVMQSAGRIVIEPSSSTLMSLGETVQLTASVLDVNGQVVEDAAISWSSSDESVATVSGRGLVTAVSNGTSTVTARSGSASSTAVVTVMQSAGRIVIEPSSSTLMSLGETVQLTASVLDVNGQVVEDAAISWSSSDESVATVSGRGLVTAVSNGTSTVTARSGSASSTAVVTVMQSAGRIVVEPSSVRLMSLGETAQLSASVLDANGQAVKDAAITWSSSDEGVATVSSQGLVTAVANGTATITARAGSASATATVTVMQSAGRIVLEPSSATLMSLDETLQLTVSVHDANGQVVEDAAISWSSSDENVATVSSQGLVTAVSNGTATITARSGSASATAAITVMQSAGRIVLEPLSATLMSLGETVQLSASVLDDNGQAVEDAVINWSSSDDDVATVSAQGLVTAVSNGTATITARSGSVSSTAAVTVMQSAGRIVIEPSSATLMSLGETVQLSGSVHDANGQVVEDAAITWSSSDEGIATVSSQGLVTAVANGTTKVTARSGSASSTATIAVIDDSRDREALIAFYTATDGPNWQNNTNWLSDKPLREWYGVSTNNIGRVTNLVLVDNLLSGQIPPELSNLDSLQELTLDRNQLTGLIPPVLGNLEKLTRLSFRRNRISGSIPPTLGNLNNLIYLDFFGNQLSGTIPVELGRLENLQRLESCCNRLSGSIPVELSNLDNLRILDLHGNEFSGSVPAELGRLQNLQQLHLNSNKLSGPIPAELGSLENLRQLVLWNNELSGTIPSTLGNLENLTDLSLDQNQLSGSIPPDLGNLENLYWLAISSNELTGSIPAELGSLQNLQNLALYRNRLSGPIPEELGGLQKLQELSLSYNQLSGPIPSTLGNLVNLQELVIGSNELSGPIPAELGALKNLRQLYLWNNELSGPIPPELGGLNKLGVLSLGGNQRLTGPLPPPLVQLTLDLVDMRSTDLCVPSTSAFQKWRSGITTKEGVTYCGSFALITLYRNSDGASWTNDENWLSEAPLNEWYGVSVSADGRVKALDLADNNMKGTLPAALGGLERLESLNLSFNKDLSGPLPRSLVGLNVLERLILKGTRLCASPDPEFQEWLGQIPDRSVAGCGEVRQDYYALTELYQSTDGTNWTNRTNWLSDAPLGSWYGVSADARGRVTALHLANNNLSGSIPAEIGELSELSSLNLWKNKLTGSIPPELGRLRYLTRMNFESNSLTGTIPAELAELRDLTYLNLKWNGLGSVIPSEFGELRNLTHLNLYGNQLTGSIPLELAELRNLTELWLGDNFLKGGIPPEIGELNNLKTLNLSSNGLTGSIPSELGQLHRLEELSLDRSGLTGDIPVELGQLRNLRALYLTENRLTGNIPSELGRLDQLEFLRLGHNQLSGDIPAELGGLERLERLHLENNRLTGDIPTELGGLDKLVRLTLDHNRLTGDIPTELGGLHNLIELRLSFNLLTGNVPSALGELANLKLLDLQENAGMAGMLPSELISLGLDEFLLGGTQLCVPPVAGFQNWLRMIPNYNLGDCQSTFTGVTAYLTQATQSLKTHPVPLVAGEDALLRVFVTSEQEVDAAIPPVRTTFYRDGAIVYTVDMPSPRTNIPIRPDEGDLASSVNVRVPGAVVEPGLEMVIEIDPDGVSDPVPGLTGRLSRDGRTPIEVADVPPFDLTLVPFLWTESPDRSVLAETEHLTAESDLFRMTRDILPVQEFFLSVREHVWTSFDPTPANRGLVILETEAIRALDGVGGHYMGIYRSYGGIAQVPGFVSVANLNGFTIAHELGHNMSLGHAPCDVLGDPAFPYPDGSIGVWGYDLVEEEAISPATPDLMSYCSPPRWISDYHFTKALRYRVSKAQVTPMAAAFASSSRGLLLWGGVNDDGELVLEPAFAVDAPAALPQMDGPYQLTGEDRDGGTLFQLTFGMTEIDHSNGGTFTFIVPSRSDWPGRLARITLSGPEGIETLSNEEGLGGERSPAALLLDSVTGKVRGILRDWPEQDVSVAAARRLAPEPGLEVVISRGVPSSEDWDR